jgi:hypothetical protein
MNFLPLQAQCMFSLLLFVIKNSYLYKSNFEIHSINTRRVKPTDLHTPASKLTKSQKGAFCFGIKVFSHLPSRVDSLSHEEKQARLSLQKEVSSYELILYVGSIL